MNNGLRVAAREERVKEYILPMRVVSYGGDVVNFEGLLTRKDLQIMLDEDDVCAFNGKSYVILDFGKEIHGGVRILVHASTAPMVRIRFGESVSECCSEVGKSSATNDHSLRDFSVQTVALSDTEWGCSGFRFVRIDVPEGAAITVKSILATFIHREFDHEAVFECSDARLNRIFETAAYTLKLNMQHHLWDGIKRDRLVWMGDIHPETLGIISIFGADFCVEEALDLLREKTPAPRFMNNMPSYSLWYLIVLADYYFQNGNVDFVKKHEEYVCELAERFTSFVTAEGELKLGSYFLDWPSFEKIGAEAGVYALFDYAMQKCELLMKVYGKTESKLAAARSRLKKDLPTGGFKQVAAFKSLAGQSDPEEIAAELVRGGARGLSTFMSYYIGKAMFEGGKKDESVSILREYYGAMLERGATSFWEDFDMNWLEGTSRIDELPQAGEKDIHGGFGAYCYVGFRHSLCHGWSCGVAPFLSEYVLGVKVLEPGCKKVEIQPFLGDLEWAKGTYPTPYGMIEIEHRKENGKILTKATAPKGVTLVGSTLVK